MHLFYEHQTPEFETPCSTELRGIRNVSFNSFILLYIFLMLTILTYFFPGVVRIFCERFKENIIKECEEEASLPSSLSVNIKSAGQVSCSVAPCRLGVWCSYCDLMLRVVDNDHCVS